MCRHYCGPKNLGPYKIKIPLISRKFVVGLIRYLHIFGLLEPNWLSNTYTQFLLL